MTNLTMSFYCLKYSNSSLLPKRWRPQLLSSANKVLQNISLNHLPLLISDLKHLFQLGCFILYPPYVPICMFFVSLLMFLIFTPRNPAFFHPSFQSPVRISPYPRTLSWSTSSSTSHSFNLLLPLNPYNIVCTTIWTSPETPSFNLWKLISPTRI